MAWASQKSQLNASLPIKKQKIHEKHGSRVYCTQPALTHSWCLFDGAKLKTLVNGKGSQERSKGSWFFFLILSEELGCCLHCPGWINTSALIEFSSHCHDISWKIITYCCLLLLPFTQIGVGQFIQGNWGALLTHLILPTEARGAFWGAFHPVGVANFSREEGSQGDQLQAVTLSAGRAAAGEQGGFRAPLVFQPPLVKLPSHSPIVRSHAHAQHCSTSLATGWIQSPLRLPDSSRGALVTQEWQQQADCERTIDCCRKGILKGVCKGHRIQALLSSLDL